MNSFTLYSFRVRHVLTLLEIEAADEPKIISNCAVISAARDKDDNSALSSFSSEVMLVTQIKFIVDIRAMTINEHSPYSVHNSFIDTNLIHSFFI